MIKHLLKVRNRLSTAQPEEDRSTLYRRMKLPRACPATFDSFPGPEQ